LKSNIFLIPSFSASGYPLCGKNLKVQGFKSLKGSLSAMLKPVAGGETFERLSPDPYDFRGLNHIFTMVLPCNQAAQLIAYLKTIYPDEIVPFIPVGLIVLPAFCCNSTVSEVFQ
jgi:hypothetical protein